MAEHLAPYRTYVIRCWKEPHSQAGTSIYRFSLEIPATGERLGFSRPEDLIHALELTLTQVQVQAIADIPPEDEVN